MSGQQHWENIYSTKSPQDVSWTQETPSGSLQSIYNTGLPKSAAIIDVGAGESLLVDHLLDAGYTNITVLDISANAIERTRQRLGNRAANVKWIVTDITTFKPPHTYDIWHDRATFHFLTTPAQQEQYINAAKATTGYLIIGTFSLNGPEKCSGLNICQYSPESLLQNFTPHFQQQECHTEIHHTPFHTQQEFLCCTFKRTTAEEHH